MGIDFFLKCELGYLIWICNDGIFCLWRKNVWIFFRFWVVCCLNMNIFLFCFWDVSWGVEFFRFFDGVKGFGICFDWWIDWFGGEV